MYIRVRITFLVKSLVVERKSRPKTMTVNRLLLCKCYKNTKRYTLFNVDKIKTKPHYFRYLAKCKRTEKHVAHLTSRVGEIEKNRANKHNKTTIHVERIVKMRLGLALAFGIIDYAKKRNKFRNETGLEMEC